MQRGWHLGILIFRSRSAALSRPGNKANWGEPPWKVDFHPAKQPVPQEVDFAVVGGGFTGLATAAWLRRLAPDKSVALFEAGSLGSGSSGHTGGIALAETAAGDLPGLGDVLRGYSEILDALQVDCDLALPGVWEIGRNGGLADSPISWKDSGELRAVRHVAGGSVNPCKLVAGLARAAERLGARIFEMTRVQNIVFGSPLRLEAGGKQVTAGKVLLATNAMSLELNGLVGHAEPKFTLALATAPLSAGDMEKVGLASGKPFYTIDLPYLWGRVLETNRLVFGSGLVHLNGWRDLEALDIEAGEAAELMTRLEGRVRGLHPVLQSVEITHRWGGPILIAEQWQPVFARHPSSLDALVLGAYSGHGVALSVYLGRWAAEGMLGRKELPNWEAAGQE
jgi:glycine/D-amino acid oxidase-like deaminating enzyme